jgi:hypothetical protein
MLGTIVILTTLAIIVLVCRMRNKGESDANKR